MIRVLHVIGAMDRAGAETMIMNYYRAIDRDQIQFDFLVHTDRHCDYDDEIESLGGKIYRIPRFNGVNYFSYKKTCREFFESHPEIQIVHGHIESSASIYLPEAKKTGKRTICHSHQSKGPLSLFEIAFRLATMRNKQAAEFYMAPSKQAGLDRFGTEIVQSDRFRVLRNAIDLKKYRSNEDLRQKAKAELGVIGKPVFGHVGRFTDAKNHPFLIEIFSEIKQELPDAQLILAGRGENEQAIRDLIKTKRLDDSVHFLGIRNDVEYVMQAMDVFIFPSLWEGLGIVLVEAQASGLPCIASSSIPKEAILLDSVRTLSLNEPTSQWAAVAVELFQKGAPNKIDEAKIAEYSIEKNSKDLSEFYLSLS